MSICARSSMVPLVAPRVVVERLEINDSSYIKTTIYELIEALQDIVGPDEDALVVAIVSYLLCDGRTAFLSQ